MASGPATKKSAHSYLRSGHLKVTPMSTNRLHEHLDGIGPTFVDDVNLREVEHDRLLARQEVGNTIDRRSRGCCQRSAEGRDASVGLPMEIDHKGRDRRPHFGRR